MIEAPSILVDTNIVSYLLSDSERAASCRPHIQGRVAAISFQTVAELWYGAEHAGWKEARRDRLERIVKSFVILTADEPTARVWAELKVEAERAGRSKGAADLWIAATAKRHDLPLLTDDRDFFSALSIRALRPADRPV